MLDKRESTHLDGGNYSSLGSRVSENELLSSASVRAAVEAAREQEARFGHIEARIAELSLVVKHDGAETQRVLEQILAQTTKTNGSVLDLQHFRDDHKVQHAGERDFRAEIEPRMQEVEGDVQALKTERNNSKVAGAAKAGLWHQQYRWLAGGIALGSGVMGLVLELSKVLR